VKEVSSWVATLPEHVKGRRFTYFSPNIMAFNLPFYKKHELFFGGQAAVQNGKKLNIR
jgi:hypothetical protein